MSVVRRYPEEVRPVLLTGACGGIQRRSDAYPLERSVQSPLLSYLGIIGILLGSPSLWKNSAVSTPR